METSGKMTLNSLKCQLRTCLGIFQLFITLRQQLQQSKQNTKQTGAERKCPSDSSEMPTLWRAGHTSTMSETALAAFRRQSSGTSSESYKRAVGAHGNIPAAKTAPKDENTVLDSDSGA